MDFPQFKVLVIDDQEFARTLMESLLTKIGVTVLTADTGEQGVAIVAENPEDISMVFLDIRMPGMKGFDVASALRVRGYQGPIVAVTGQATMADRREAKQVGICSYLSKTTVTKDLLQALLEQHCTAPKVKPERPPA